jgi:hypothetical protein
MIAAQLRFQPVSGKARIEKREWNAAAPFPTASTVMIEAAGVRKMFTEYSKWE